MKKVLRIPALLLVTAALVALPYRLWIGPIPWGSVFGGGGADAVSGASVIRDAPSGSYVVLLNRDAHKKPDTADAWADFFRGESLVIMDDVRCLVGMGDADGFGMADSYRSRLPENQMKLRAEEPAMLLSRATLGRFDVIVMSREFADANRADTAYGVEGVQVIEVGGEAA